MREPKCRYFNKPCLKHDCVQYVQLLGKNPQTGEDQNTWTCVDLANVQLNIEVARQVRKLSTAVTVFRNVMIKISQIPLNQLQLKDVEQQMLEVDTKVEETP